MKRKTAMAVADFFNSGMEFVGAPPAKTSSRQNCTATSLRVSRPTRGAALHRSLSNERPRNSKHLGGDLADRRFLSTSFGVLNMEYLSPEWQAELNKLVREENTRITNLLINAMTGDDMTTNPHLKAGGSPPTQLHRVDASLLSDNRVVEQFGEMPVQYAGPEPDDEDGPPEMLAFALILTFVCVSLGLFIAGVWA